MPRIRQIMFVGSILALCWLGMMAIQEPGHVIGAVMTRGTVQRCVLHPMAILRTDVLPNPHPVVVVWMGPIMGSVLPIAALYFLPSRFPVTRQIVQFFARFCLVANGRKADTHRKEKNKKSRHSGFGHRFRPGREAVCSGSDAVWRLDL